MISPLAAETTGPDSVQTTFLARSIHSELSGDKSLPITGLRVDDRGGIIVLRGSTPNLRVRIATERYVRGRIGVRGVVNELKVQTNQRETGDLAGVVIAALEANPYVKSANVSISLTGDTVILAGRVGNEFEKDHAGRTAGSVPGVAAVINRLVVRDIAGEINGNAPARSSDDPAVQAMIESYYSKQGVKPELSLKMDSTINLAAEWRDSLYLNPPKAGGQPRVVNPETRYYEAFNFVGLGIYLIKKAFGWDNKKDKKKDKD